MKIKEKIITFVLSGILIVKKKTAINIRGTEIELRKYTQKFYEVLVVFIVKNIKFKLIQRSLLQFFRH